MMIIPLNPLRCRDIDLGSTQLSKEVLEEILGQCQSRDIIYIKTMSGPDSHDETLTLLADKDQNTMEEKQFVLGRCGQQRISQTVYDDMDAAQEAVGALVDDYKTTLYTNVSRIKKKLTDKLGQKVAAPLLITRTDGVYKIPVKRELVSYR